MTSNPDDLTIADYLDAAWEMHAAQRPYLAYLLVEEAAERTTDPATAHSIRAQFPDPNARKD
ncbi:hypothetical protein OOK36_13980 [Streptomyces sp. NBC_00365]|uniref:hypothetical protein n=1 Tax=Streptomyces sp. NBC_00365 TaxID=2975726 RepID=UPI0022530B7E|nr:hypothetical protein [Streptomyces sp. NBC_00365]MCX5089994.1 hypothetical protein [Streptomyces sp. NBC_00365]